MNYIAVRGQGNPNEENGAYKQAIGLLYALAFTIKMSPKAGYKIAGYFDYVTFTSASTVKGLLSAIGPGPDLTHFTGLCIGPQTAAEAEKHGITVKTAPQATIDALVNLAVKMDEKV